MYDMYYYDNINGEYNDIDPQDDQQFADSDDENLGGLYVEGLADRIWEDNDWKFNDQHGNQSFNYVGEYKKSKPTQH